MHFDPKLEWPASPGGARALLPLGQGRHEALEPFCAPGSKCFDPEWAHNALYKKTWGAGASERSRLFKVSMFCVVVASLEFCITNIEILYITFSKVPCFRA